MCRSLKHDHHTPRPRAAAVRRRSMRWFCRQLKLLARLDPNEPVTRRTVDHNAIDRALERVERRERGAG